jgi:hypothetical protein
MSNQVVTKIQLIQPGIQGYLDVSETLPFPMNYSISDIRDISKRNGSFSKTVTLPGTKNNNTLLNYYFDVNILNGTFNVNKVQECIVLMNNVPVTKNAFLQLISVKKSQNIQTEDDEVTYEVVIKENVAEFFTRVSQKELTDLDFTDLDIGVLLNSTEIVGSFNNTIADGYKWLMPWKNTPAYVIQDFKPAIYAKEYWDRIHADAGFSYSWPTLSDNNVQFDKLIIPYNGDEKRASESLKNSTKVIADRTGSSDYINEVSSFGPVPQLGSVHKINGISTSFSPGIGLYVERLDALNEVDDPGNYWAATQPNPPGATGGVYTSPVGLYNPAYLNYNFSLDYTIEVEKVTAGTTQLFTPYNGQRPTIIPKLRVRNLNTSTDFDVALQGYQFPQQIGNPVSGNLIVANVNNYQVDVSIAPVNIGDRLVMSTIIEIPYEIRGPQSGGQFKVRLKVTRCSVTVTINSDSMLLNQPINFNDFIPTKIKQSEFLKSIYQMYNLYIETDPSDSTKLIYRHRDQYYDSGQTIDWTEKFARNEPQDLKFLPELSNKRIILTYKQDDDFANKAYQQEIKEIYGQQEIIFQNEYVKNVDTKSLIFSPTPSQKTNFQATLPLIDGLSPSNNIRILLDGGERSCAQWILFNGGTFNFQFVNTFPFLSHFSEPDNPNFDINYGVCKYYFYNIDYPTNNNLYNNFWRRTMAQIDTSKLLTAYFWLDEYDIQRLKLNDKIRIDNSYWNINKIIDFDASANVLTKVELISIDPDLDLPNFGRPSKFTQPWQVFPVDQDFPILSNATLSGVRRITDKFVKDSLEISNIRNSDKSAVLLGTNNLVGSEFTGVVNTDRDIVRQSGYVIGGTTYTQNGEIARFGKIVDAGLDIVYDRNNMSRVTLVDGTNDYLGVTGGAILPINPDYNWGTPIRNGGNVDVDPFPL